MRDLPPTKKRMKTKKVRSPERDSLLFAGLVERVTYEGCHCSMNERALLIIVAALDCYPERPYDDSMPLHQKEEITFSQWALGELLDLVWDHPWTLASETIEDFAMLMQFYASTSITEKQNRIFTIAANTALEILEEIEEVEK